MSSHAKYWLIIGLCIFLVFSLNIIFAFEWITLFYCAFALGIVLLPGILFATILEFLPEKIFNPDSYAFRVYKFENNFYEKLGIKSWKDKIPVIKPMRSKFDKANLVDPKSAEYLYIFIKESCKAELGHGFSIIWGFLCAFICMFVLPSKFVLTAYLPVLVVSTIVHFLSYAIQRYIRPKLIRLYKLTKTREENAKKLKEETNK